MLRYTMIKHGMDSGNEVNDGRNQLLEVSHTFQIFVIGLDWIYCLNAKH